MIDWLRSIDNDVLWIAEDYVSTLDHQVLNLATSSSRILLTRDLDFGEFVYREKRNSSGIILLRVTAKNQFDRLEIFRKWWPKIEDNANENFLVVSNNRIRIRPLGY